MTEKNKPKYNMDQIHNLSNNLANDITFINNIFNENMNDNKINYGKSIDVNKKLIFIFKYLSKSIKYKDLKIFFKYKEKRLFSLKIKNDKSNNPNSKFLSGKSIFVSYFINICIKNHKKLSQHFLFSDKYMVYALFKLMKFLFINDIIDEDGLKLIIGLQLLLCLYNTDKKSEKIEDLDQINLVIDALLSFCNNKKYQLNEDKKKKINNVIDFVINIIKKNILINFANVCLLSRSKKLFKLIGLSQITSDSITKRLISLLVEVYKYKFNIDFIFDDLSEQFLYKIENDYLENKIKLLIAKNDFLNLLYKKEAELLSGELIKNGFYFSDFNNNGIQCQSMNKLPLDHGFSLVVSFKLMTNKTGNKDIKYTIFSLTNFSSTNKGNNIMNVYIENFKLKIKTKQIFELNNEIRPNEPYVLWINQTKDKKMIIFLNETKTIIKNTFSKENYKISLGCNINEKNISFNNFIGIIGNFILFKKSLIKDEKDNKNITKLLELKGSYEDIPDISSKKEWNFLDKDINLTLNLLLNDIDTNKDIELIISSKSFGNDNLVFNSPNILSSSKKTIYCNYFQNSSLEKKSPRYNFRNEDFLVNNQSFPFFSHYSFFDFLNGHGFLYLQLELEYLTGVVSFKMEEKTKDKTNKNIKIFDGIYEEAYFYTDLTKITSFFFSCLDLLNSSICFNSFQTNMFQKEIRNFKYTLIDLVNILCKYDCKLKSYFLMQFCNKIKEKQYLEFCSFVLNFDFYGLNDNDIFKILFNELNHIFNEDCDNIQIKTIFIKLISFDKIYIIESIDKNNKKEYSKLIRLLLKKSFDEKLTESIEEYVKRLKQLKTDFSNDNLFNDVSNIQEEDYINVSEKRNNKFSIDSTNSKEGNIIKDMDSRKESYNKKESIDSGSCSPNVKKNFEYLILIYKYLKNLYISIPFKKKEKNNSIDLYEDMKNDFTEFFNDLFSTLERIFPLENNYSEKEKKILIIVEYIKSLCIRLLDDLFFDDNYSNLKQEEEKLKNKGEDLDELDNKSTGNFRKSNLSSGSFVKTKTNYIKGNQKGSFLTGRSSKNLYLNLMNSNNISKKSSFISNYNLANKTVEEILTSQMEFFNNFILSEYTFRSFVLMLFRDYPNDKKIKFIKNNNEKHFNFSLDVKEYNQIRYSLKVILTIIEKLDADEIDTQFMTKIQLIEYIYASFSKLINNTLKNYLKIENKSEEEISMIKNLFDYQKNTCYADKFYKTILVCISSIKENNKKELLNKIENDMKEFIKDSLFYLENLFYFKTLREIYFELDNNDNIDEFIFNIQLFLMKIICEYFSKNEKNKIIEINCKNTLIFLYKIIFYIKKRSKILEKELFIKEVFTFLSQILDHSTIIYTKILFPIEDSRGKLLMEVIYEIIFELYVEYLKNPKVKSLQASEPLLKSLFDKNKLKTSLGAVFKDESLFKFFEDDDEYFTPLYVMDKISDYNYITSSKNYKNLVEITTKFSINEFFFDLRNQLIDTFKSERLLSNNSFSVCILFAIKIILSIKELREFYSNNKNILSPTHSSNSETNNSDGKTKNNNDFSIDNNEDNIINDLEEQMKNLFKNILRIQEESNTSNPFKSIGIYSKNIYEHFRSYIIDKLKIKNPNYTNIINDLIESVNKYKKDLKFFSRVIYIKEGRIILYNEENVSKILSNLKKQAKTTEITPKGDNESFSSANDLNSNSDIILTKNIKSNRVNFELNDRKSFNKDISKNDIYLNDINSHSQKQLYKMETLLNKINLDEFNKQKIIYEPRAKFKKDLIRKYFSFYFKKLLTYDEDFLNIKKLYTLTYDKEIEEIDKYKISYPTRIKNYICNNYDKIFLKKDFGFFTDGYFEYSHDYLYNKKNNYNYKFQNKYIFPSKQLIRDNDSLFQEIFSKIIIKEATKFECELITIQGTIFGYIYILDNCLLFKSEIENDKRLLKNKTEKDYEMGLFYVCCSIDYDFLKKEKIILMEFNNIKEVINHTFAYIWISLEIFLKDGRSFLFNLFNEDLHSDFFEILKQKKVPTIKKMGEYFRKEELSKKWKEEKISTYDYLLLLNKLSSRSYNDTNQYPVLPWLFLIKGKKQIRNFDLPISVQEEKEQEEFLSKGIDFISNEKELVHGNHYSTSAYTCFYLMRANPFTNGMIKFQSNCFDLPDRQFFDIKQTIILCQNLSNNRELIPELYSIPEIYINFNDNDFGKQKGGLRIHNISFEPYANNVFQFCYLIKDLINNDPEINNQINKWFDFIFGVNQLGNYSTNKNLTYQEKEKMRILRKFNSHSYGKLFNYNKIALEAQKHCRNNKSLYDDIKISINLVTNFGQCPYQLLNEVHPSKNKYVPTANNSSGKNNYQFESNLFDENYSSEKNNLYYNITNYNKGFEEIKRPMGQDEIIFFTKSSNNDLLYCLLKCGIINIYKIEGRNKNFTLVKEIKPKCQFLSLKETKIKNKNFQIFNPKYLFCEINENSFILGRTLDRTLIYYNFSEDFETSFLLKSYTISIISIKNNEFITGSDNGFLCKWKINLGNKDKKVDLELLLIVKSNQNAITSLYYDERLNIIISTDINTVSIRKYYDFEHLNFFDIKESKGKYIKEVKVSDFNFLYILIFDEQSEYYELQGYTINGTYFGKYEGIIFNFEISKTGKLIVNELEKDQLIIKALHPVNFYEIQYKEISDEGISFHFYFEKPNIIYYGIKNNKDTKIKIIILLPGESNIFYMNDIC